MVRKERGAEKRFKIAGLTRGAYSLGNSTLRPDEESPVKPLRKSLNVDGSLRECLTKDETAAATVNQLRSRVPQAAEKASLRWLLVPRQSKGVLM